MTAVAAPDLRELSALSTRVGGRIDLVQGAGGNVSLKRDGRLWVKASGKWLVDAVKQNIFVSVDLRRARALIEQEATDLSSCMIDENGLKPSIETAFHALIAYPVVLHLHSINTLAWAVRKDGRDSVALRLEGLDWGWLDYARPGIELAAALRILLTKRKALQVIVLGNHGLLLAGESVNEVEELIATVEERLSVSPRPWSAPSDGELARFSSMSTGRLPALVEVHALARDRLSLHISSRGAMYPDHAVFLGRHLPVLGDEAGTADLEGMLATPPYCAVIADRAVMLGRKCTAASEAMLACCALVALRQNDAELVKYLPSSEVEALEVWDLEMYRRQENRGH